MTRIKESTLGETPFQKLIGHNKEVMEAWIKLGDIFEKDGLLSAELKEQVRRTLAQHNGCEYCKAKGKPEVHKFTEKISVAVGFAEVFTKERGEIPDSSFKILKDYFSDAEISELCAFITFTAAQQHFGAIMKLQPVSVHN